MADELPAALTEEVSVALTSLVRLTLPPERWPAVAEVVHRMDDAVWLGQEAALKTELKKLRSAVIGTAPRPRPGEGAAPVVNPLSYRTTDYLGRTPVRWISIIMITGAAVLATLLILLVVVLAFGGGDHPTPAAPTTTVTAPTMTPEPVPPPEEPGGGASLTSIGLLVLAGIGGFAFVIWRRRARARMADPQAEEPAEELTMHLPHPTDGARVPSEVAESVERLVAELERRRGPS
ncbi:hypothetical protein [[Mycobacterium] wendilense]|uniref:Anti-sigma-D factor RsdA sigma factor binding region domain-containing protein n=1 Tax=[Mycobacterium] wendilense TaxID=3064284 RepID=A0ABM9MEZ7_9MYCO|nr:hypothetical protein [Mycolicibacterium sp. MU0050]CAJ1583630.1 hypothetical protein MU0050_002732 [Mycolicibacterium sp. MU0050]